MSQRKHKRRVYAKQAQHLYSSWEDLKPFLWMEDCRWFDEMLESYARRLANPSLASMWPHVATDILKIQVTS